MQKVNRSADAFQLMHWSAPRSLLRAFLPSTLPFTPEYFLCDCMDYRAKNSVLKTCAIVVLVKDTGTELEPNENQQH